MIYKLTFDDGRFDYCTAKDQLHLLKSYDASYFGLSLQEIESIDEISDEEAKLIIIKNTDELPEETNLYELAVSDDFAIIASTEFN